MEAKDYLTGSVSCVLKRGDELLLSQQSGIRPMLDWIGEGRDLQGFDAADKIVGKAAAMLFVKAGIRAVYAAVLSRPGKEYLERHGIAVTYDTLTERIINRRGDGLCPMEETVLHIHAAEEGYAALVKKAEELRRNH